MPASRRPSENRCLASCRRELAVDQAWSFPDFHSLPRCFRSLFRLASGKLAFEVHHSAFAFAYEKCHFGQAQTQRGVQRATGPNSQPRVDRPRFVFEAECRRRLSPHLVIVTVMHVGIVRVRVFQSRVLMAVSVGLARRIARRMLVLVVLIVIMEMFVFHWLMNMLMFMSFADVKPNSDQHEDPRSAERPIEPALSNCEGERGACKRGGGEIGSGASCAEMTEGANEKNETDAIAQKTDGGHGEGDAQPRQFRASDESEADIYRASSKTLPHGDLRRIAA